MILAARIAAHARGGEILVSALFRELVRSNSELPFGAVREIELEGLAGRHALCAVGWDGREPAPLAGTTNEDTAVTVASDDAEITALLEGEMSIGEAVLPRVAPQEPEQLLLKFSD